MKRVVITGAGGGLGSTIVSHLEREYECIGLTHRDVDLADEAAVTRRFEEIGEIYGLVHLVGGWAAGTVAETDSATWSVMLALNATTAFHAIRAALPHLARPGRIVAVSSIATLTPSSGAAAYFVAKSALNALIQAVAAEQRANGITANAVLPDALATPKNLADGGDAAKLVPPSRVAATIAFLFSDDAAGTTGMLIPIR